VVAVAAGGVTGGSIVLGAAPLGGGISSAASALAAPATAVEARCGDDAWLGWLDCLVPCVAAGATAVSSAKLPTLTVAEHLGQTSDCPCCDGGILNWPPQWGHVNRWDTSLSSTGHSTAETYRQTIDRRADTLRETNRYS
jgi:hypothetical protein